MCNKKNVRKSNQRGVSLILVLFLIVILGLLMAAMMQLNRVGSNAVSTEVQSTRALFAAESGAQVAAMNIFPINGTTLTSCPFANLSQTFPTGSGLNGCTATESCGVVNTAGRVVFTITSEGKCGSGYDYARRKITVGLRNL